MRTQRPIKVSFEGEVEEINDVNDAADFLQRWPIDRRGHVYRSALNACSAAIAAQIPAGDALKAFTGFARVTGILVQSDGPEMPAGRTGAQNRMPK
ncbi:MULTISPECIES: DUF982 domain-containing protein [unclassified Mesorhizobium]|uniref:DUF982 domain-containing protein n=1 Tax=unclassified Mesorhizobium TaxID=325217 RepID=UPI000FDA7490|nr:MULTISPECIES: DUF982 domain-containing protein [unclassified Mesorhizobium]TGQ34666.1 DUF982 domain-containing protein [Mesorhizobium sp. M00.F.Ca.ET.216.01.1.1]TIS57602.1 MAG: DUF982 domain-containing protein [Mesorhizobium sp.]TIS88621.1 MAG: DUF982 domain-containing protein [Mesorhizobium sp.]TJW07262.1 MAG: DUF982 domain-containing protein [Mesorhizobium sp.]TJW43512.1 MAG: DUF982 domain-containing protein [Mesorhizobium sp.]